MNILYAQYTDKFIIIAIKSGGNGQSRETDNTGHTKRREAKQKLNTICVGHHCLNEIYN
jgi:hypothetical protein